MSIDAVAHIRRNKIPGANTSLQKGKDVPPFNATAFRLPHSFMEFLIDPMLRFFKILLSDKDRILPLIFTVDSRAAGMPPVESAMVHYLITKWNLVERQNAAHFRQIGQRVSAIDLPPRKYHHILLLIPFNFITIAQWFLCQKYFLVTI